eukprot:m.25038 g.25038  ORF g.25038 m.25038 type:complete len:116 (+) comp11302_c0_seq3:192-539(+)
MSSQQDNGVMRVRQWVYLGPILAAPLAHIAVTSYRHAKTPTGKRLVLYGGVVGATVLSISMRLYLMHHAGYTGAGSVSTVDDTGRFTHPASEEERRRLQEPGLWGALREALRGFG